MRFSAPVLLAAALLVSGCKKKETAPTSEPTGSAAPMTKPVPPPASDPAATPAAAAAPGPVVGWEKLSDINLPNPKGTPEKGIWSSVKATKDGDRWDNFVDGNDNWMGMRILDCNLPAVQALATKPDPQSVYSTCFATPTGKLKDYPLIATNDAQRAVKVGHLVLIASLNATGQAKLKAADLEAFLESLDLAAIAKL